MQGNLLSDDRGGNKHIYLAELQHRLINGSLNALVVTDVDLLEHDGNAVLPTKLDDSLVTVLLEDIEDHERLQINVAERIGNAVAETASSARRSEKLV
jgi:hypothetical protein